MLYKVSNRLDEKVASLSQERLFSTKIGIEISNYVNEDKQIPTSGYIEVLKSAAKHMIEIDPKFDEERLLTILSLQERIDNICKFDNELEFVMMNLYNNACMFHLNDLVDNPYLKNVKFEYSNSYVVENETYSPYELFMYDNSKRVKGTNIDMPCVGCFDCNVSYPVLKKDDKVIASVDPYVIKTMEEYINKAHGDVLVYGLKMGYFVYMASLKEDVKSITVVEDDPELIDFFVKNKVFNEKVKFSDSNEYDYCLVDKWNDFLDIEGYFKMKETLKDKCDYYLESAIVNHLMGYVFIEIMDAFYKAKEMKVPNYASEPGYLYRDHKYISELLKNAKLSKEENIDYYMNPDTIIKLINKSDIIF